MLRKIHIKNFKGILDLSINCDDKLNVFMGKNNAGKTSIFEAIHLWKKCYDSNITKKKNKFYSHEKPLLFREMECLRVRSDKELFSNYDKPIRISLEFDYFSDTFNLGFIIKKVGNIEGAYLRLSYMVSDEFEKFSTFVQEKDLGNLSFFFSINESKPISSIIAKEPRMYRSQVLEKISKGKSFEVLRNKIIWSLQQNNDLIKHLQKVFGIEYKLTYYDRSLPYIDLKVDGVNILSQGSGFLQITEIFSSLVYSNSKINILLIDEPDSHLHAQLQRKLLDELCSIQQSQTFIITHNERFLEDVAEEKIRFISEDVKIKKEEIVSIPKYSKGLIMENLVGSVNDIDKFKYLHFLVFVEGYSDNCFLIEMFKIYKSLTTKEINNYIIYELTGIDTINDKLKVFSKSLKDIVSNDTKWIVFRDTDFIPIDKQNQAKTSDLNGINENLNIDLYFQNGYGLESTFIAEPEKLAKILMSYYNIEDNYLAEIKNILIKLNTEYLTNLPIITSDLNKNLEHDFNEQKKRRIKSKIYKNLEFREFIEQIKDGTFQYIMTKKILNNYLKLAHDKISSLGQQNTVLKCLNSETIFNAYYKSIKIVEDIYDCHMQILNLFF